MQKFALILVQFERRKVDKKANLHENWNMYYSILESFEFVCQMWSKSIRILVILSYTISKLVHFLADRTNGRTIGAVSCLSSSVCNVKYCG